MINGAIAHKTERFKLQLYFFMVVAPLDEHQKNHLPNAPIINAKTDNTRSVVLQYQFHQFRRLLDTSVVMPYGLLGLRSLNNSNRQSTNINNSRILDFRPS
jgi:hypothetical protein